MKDSPGSRSDLPKDSREFDVPFTEEDYRALIDQAPDAIFIADRKFRVILANNHGCEISGYSQTEVLKKSIFDFTVPEDVAANPLKFDELNNGKTVVSERKLKRKDGTIIPVEVSSKLLNDGRLQMIVRDISRRKRAEREHQKLDAALRESEEKLSLAMRAANMGSWALDIHSLEFGADGVAKVMHGFSKDEPISGIYQTLRFIHPEDLPETKRRFKRAFQTRGAFESEYRVVLPDGQTRWILSSGSVHEDTSYLIGMVQDITERKQAEEVLRASEDRYRDLVDNMRDLVCAHDLQGRLLFVNRASAELLGYQPHELLERNLREILDPRRRHLFDHYIRTIQAEGEASGMMLVRTRAGQARIWEYHNTLRRWGTGEPTVRGLARDITERKQSEALVNGQKQVLEMIAKGAPLEKTLRRLIEILEAQSPGMLGSIVLLDDDGVHVRHGAAASLPDRFAHRVDGLPIGPKAGSCGTAVFRRESVIVEDIQTDPLWEDYRALAAEQGLRACWSTPIFDAQKKVLGSFAMYYRDPGRPTENHLRLIEIGTQIAAVAISRQRTEAALRHSEARLRLSVEAGNVGLWDWDLKTNKVYYSPEWKSQIGYRDDEISDDFSEWESRVHPDDLARTLKKVKAYLANPQGRYEVEYRFRHKDQSYRCIYTIADVLHNADGQPWRMLGCHVDITERKRAEESVRRSEKRLRELIDGLGPYTFVGLMDCDGILLEANHSALAAANLRAEDVLGKPFDQTYWWSYSEAVQRQLRSAIARARAGHGSRYEVRVRVAQNKFIIVDFSLQPVCDEAGNVMFIVPSANVITERKDAESRLKASSKQLRALSARVQTLREEESARIARELHDELGGALTGLKWDLEGIDQTLTSSANGDATASAREKISGMNQLIDTTINTVRRISSELRPGMLDDLGLVAALEWQAQQFQQRTGIKVTCDLIGEVNISRDRAIAVFRILQEILTNVLRHAQAKRVTVKMRNDDHRFKLEVFDNGCGIDPDQVNSSASLGLLGMRERAYLVGGSVQINSVKGRGTLVTVTVPVE